MADERIIYPGREWGRATPEEANVNPEKLKEAENWLSRNANGRRYGIVVVRGGRIVAEWYGGVDPSAQFPMASAAKSLYGCVLAIAADEGVINSIDDRVVEYYPEMMDIPQGCGPKESRFAREKDREVTFRQLISNTSGYLKPGENPGEVFHYQTFGMNILTHAIAKAYGYYDPRDPGNSPGFARLLEEKIRDPIGARWTWEYSNFALPPEARINIFGNFTQVLATPRDMGRIGLLWLRDGRWDNRQIVPREWITQATRVVPEVRAAAPPDKWAYGYGFWSNELQKHWPQLPSDSFAAEGAGSKLIWVCPSLDLIVVECPGLFKEPEEENTGLLPRILDAC